MRKDRKLSTGTRLEVVAAGEPGEEGPTRVVYEFEPEDERESYELEREISAKRLMEHIEGLPPCDRERVFWEEIRRSVKQQEMLEIAAVGAARLYGYPACRLILRQISRGLDPTPFVLALLPDRHPLRAFAEAKAAKIDTFRQVQERQRVVLNEARAALEPSKAEVIEPGLAGWHE